MKILLITLITSTALFVSDAPTLRSKPIQCSSPEAVINYYVDGGNLQAEWVAVSQLIDQTSNISHSVVTFWLNRTTGEWMLMEGDKEEVCVISLGTDLSFDVDTDRLITLYTGRRRT